MKNENNIWKSLGLHATSFFCTASKSGWWSHFRLSFLKLFHVQHTVIIGCLLYVELRSLVVDIKNQDGLQRTCCPTPQPDGLATATVEVSNWSLKMFLDQRQLFHNSQKWMVLLGYCSRQTRPTPMGLWGSGHQGLKNPSGSPNDLSTRW